MRRFWNISLIWTVALMAALGPPVLTTYLAREQGMLQEMGRVQEQARVVVQRSDRAVAQMQAAIDTLIMSGGAGPLSDRCSDSMLRQMRELALRMEFMKVAGVVDQQRYLRCSSLGIHEPPIDLGPPDTITALGTQLRLSAPMPLVEDIPYISIARDGFVAMAHRNQAVDVPMEIEGAMLATFNPLDNEIRTVRGTINPAWTTRLGDQNEATFVDGSYLVAVLRSDQIQLTGALAAIPISYVNQQVSELTWRVVPFSILAAIFLTWAFLYFARQQTSMAAQIRLGLRRDEFYLEYQPIVEMDTGRWIGAEALLRWRRRNGEVIYPDIFIPVAEQQGLIHRLTQRVIRKVESDMATLLATHPFFLLSINLSAADIEHPQTADALLALCNRHDILASQLMVELTERMLVNPQQAHDVLQGLRKKGVKVGIDDFGTGYSSLSYLERFAFDCLKIDKLFVEAIDKEAATSRVVLHIIEMASTLGLNVVAEGVESESQVAFLQEHGVRYAQGWLYSHSLPADAFRSAFAEKLTG